mmetsp:Transcript_38121/g.89346  ORF Transcript_38121/g.89346 Transcript_38121/m.89346 type:complete len:232 (-) Transcript_38121:182-877(-)
MSGSKDCQLCCRALPNLYRSTPVRRLSAVIVTGPAAPALRPRSSPVSLPRLAGEIGLLLGSFAVNGPHAAINSSRDMWAGLCFGMVLQIWSRAAFGKLLSKVTNMVSKSSCVMLLPEHARSKTSVGALSERPSAPRTLLRTSSAHASVFLTDAASGEVSSVPGCATSACTSSAASVGTAAGTGCALRSWLASMICLSGCSPFNWLLLARQAEAGKCRDQAVLHKLPTSSMS